MSDITQPPPAIKRSVVQLYCTRCGAEANASCSCGVAYEVLAERKEAHRQANKAYRERKRQENQTSRDITQGEQQMQTEQVAAKPDEGKILNKLTCDVIDAGYEALAVRFSYDKPTMTRLVTVRNELRNQFSEWF